MVSTRRFFRTLNAAVALTSALLVASPGWAAVTVKATPSTFTVGPGPHEVTIEVVPTPALPSMCQVTLQFGDGATVTLKSGPWAAKHAFVVTRPRTFVVKAVVGGGFVLPGQGNPCSGEATAEVKAINPPVLESHASPMVATPAVKPSGSDPRTVVATPVVSGAGEPCEPPGCVQIVVEATPTATGPGTVVTFKATPSPSPNVCKLVIDFGDGKQQVMALDGAASTAAHAYEKRGKYVAKVVCPVGIPVGLKIKTGSAFVDIR